MTVSDIRHLSPRRLKHVMISLCQAAGIPDDLSLSVVNGLLQTSLRGVDSHGIRLLPHYLRAARIGRINIHPRIAWKQTSASTYLMDADHAFGIVAGTLAMEKATVLAKTAGIGAVAVRHSSHFGAAALYSTAAARQNLIGLSCTNVDALVIPFGGKRAALGTNPICFAAPCTGEEPFCLDMATSTIPWNKVSTYRDSNVPLEEGWAVDAAGVPTTDPHAAVALTPFGGYKGYGLALMVEIFTSLLAGMPAATDIAAMYPLDRKKRNLAHFFLAIDIARFQPVSRFKKRLKTLLDLLRSQPPAEEFSQVLVPGDPENSCYAKRIRTGVLIPDAVREDYRKLAKEMGIRIAL